MHKALFNGSASPVRVDDEGREVGPGEFGVGDSTSDALKAAHDAGTVSYLSGTPGKDSNPDALAAFQRAGELNAAAKSANPKQED